MLSTVKIELRQHQDGSFVIAVQNGATREINITHIIHEIFREKLLDLQARVTNDEKYLNWMVESYNKKYVIISPREWNIYCDNGTILSCVLKNVDGTNFFVITEQ